MIKKIITFSFIIISFHCQTWGHYNRIDLTTQKISASDVLVEGRSCRLFFTPLYPNVEDAVTDALSKAPGKKGIKNPEIIDVFYFFSPVKRCTFVKGFATNEEPISKPYK